MTYRIGLLFSLGQGKTGLAVKLAQVLHHHHRKAGLGETLEQGDNLRLCERSGLFPEKAALKTAATKGFGHTFGPQADTAVGNHAELQAGSVEGEKSGGEMRRIAIS